MIALERLLERIIVDNPIATVPQGLFRLEIRTYPNIALREALLNAFVHADYRIHGPILVKQYARHRDRRLRDAIDAPFLSEIGAAIGKVPI